MTGAKVVRLLKEWRENEQQWGGVEGVGPSTKQGASYAFKKDAQIGP